MSELVMSPSMAAALAAEQYGTILEGVESPEPVERMRLGAWVACQAAVEIGPGSTADDIRQYTAGAVAGDWALEAVTAVQAHEVADGAYGTIMPERNESLAAIAGLLARYRDSRQHHDIAAAFAQFSWTGAPPELSRYRTYPRTIMKGQGGKAPSRTQQPEGEQ